MQYDRPLVVSIAGFDPCGGAGVLADIKTFEQHACMGLAVLTANTVQVEDQFIRVDWQSNEAISIQLNALLDKYPVSAVKIGMIKNLESLIFVCKLLKEKDPSIFIAWDSVLSATSGFNFMKDIDRHKLEEALLNIDLITPNADELKQIAALEDEVAALKAVGRFCPVLLKGGHRIGRPGVDTLFINGNMIDFHPTSESFESKHGTGCILSSAIVCNIARGRTLEKSCQLAKEYLNKTANSNKQLLAYHYV